MKMLQNLKKEKQILAFRLQTEEPRLNLLSCELCPKSRRNYAYTYLCIFYAPVKEVKREQPMVYSKIATNISDDKIASIRVRPAS